MERRLTLLPALVLACATVLAGVPLIAAPTANPHSGPCVAPTPVDPEGVSDLRGETVEEEREEEGADSDVKWFARPVVAVVFDPSSSSLVAVDSFQAAIAFFTSARFSRGPPAV
jgi:hypothetical protein